MIQSGWWPHCTPSPLTGTPPSQHSSQEHKAVTGIVGHRTHEHTGQSARGPCWGRSLPWELDGGRGRRGATAIGATSSRSLFLKGPQGPRAAQPLQGSGDRWSLREGSAEPPRYVGLPTSPPELVAANSWSQPPHVLGEGGGPFAVPSPQRSENPSNDT